MTSGIKLNPYSAPQGELPRIIVSPVSVSNPKASVRPGEVVGMSSLAQWDTGADFCLISPELARRLRLEKMGEASVNVFEGDNIVRQTYLVNLVLPNGIFFEDVVALEDPGLKSTDVDFLIGMDVINWLDFSLIHDDRGHTVLSISHPKSWSNGKKVANSV